MGVAREARIGGPWSKAFTAPEHYGLEPQALTMLSHLPLCGSMVQHLLEVLGIRAAF